METWIPLISAVIGAALALLGVFINNIFQAKQREEDRKEQRWEASIQAKEKWIAGFRIPPGQHQAPPRSRPHRQPSGARCLDVG